MCGCRLEPDSAAVAPHEAEDRLAGEARPARVQEHRRGVLSATAPSVRRTAARARGSPRAAASAAPATGTTRSLPPLPNTRTKPSSRSTSPQIEPHELAHAQAAPVQHLEHRAVPPRRASSGTAARAGVASSMEMVRAGARGPSAAAARRGMVLGHPLAHEEPVEALHRRDLALDRGGREPALAQRGDVRGDVLAGHAVRVGDAALRQEARYSARSRPYAARVCGDAPRSTAR